MMDDKELPFFKFNPAQYLSGDITMCSMEAQGLFTNIMCYYWMKRCKITMSGLKHRFSQAQATLDELIKHGIIKTLGDSDDVVINFLKSQRDEFIDKYQLLSNAGRTGGLKAQGRLKRGSRQAQGRLKPPSSIKEEDKEEEYSNNTIILSKYSNIIIVSGKISKNLKDKNSKEIVKLFESVKKQLLSQGKPETELEDAAHTILLADCAKYESFLKWLSEKASRVNNMNNPFSLHEYLKIREVISAEQLKDYCERMDNWRDLHKNQNAYKTIQTWITRDKDKNGR